MHEENAQSSAEEEKDMPHDTRFEVKVDILHFGEMAKTHANPAVKLAARQQQKLSPPSQTGGIEPLEEIKREGAERAHTHR